MHKNYLKITYLQVPYTLYLMDGQRGPTLEVPYTFGFVSHRIGPTLEVPWYFEETKHKNTHHQRHDVRILSTDPPPAVLVMLAPV